jgi:hypothetical protein
MFFPTSMISLMVPFRYFFPWFSSTFFGEDLLEYVFGNYIKWIGCDLI